MSIDIPESEFQIVSSGLRMARIVVNHVGFTAYACDVIKMPRGQWAPCGDAARELLQRLAPALQGRLPLRMDASWGPCILVLLADAEILDLG